MLDDDTTYEVRVKAKNGERDSAWSATGTGRTNRANHEPIFDDRPGTGDGSDRNSNDGFTVWRTIDENPRDGQVVGRVFADDEDNDSLTYKLVAADRSERGRIRKVHHQRDDRRDTDEGGIVLRLRGYRRCRYLRSAY